MGIVLNAYILECIVRGQSLQVPLGFKIRLQGAKLVNNAIAGVFQGILRVVSLGGLYSQLEPGEERMLNLISGKQHLSIVQELCADQITQRVVFLLKRYHHCVGGFSVGVNL